MDSLYKTLKDTKRRVVQAAVTAIDDSAKTVDGEYDIHAAKFPEMIKDMNECGAALHSALANQKKMFADSYDLATSLARIYQRNLTMTDWDNTTCQLQQGAAAESFKNSWESIHTVIRSSSAMVSTEMSLEPLRAAVTKMQPEIEAQCKERNTKLTDFDSYRRRLKGLEATKEKQVAKASGPGATPADQKAVEATVAEIARFEGKREAAECAYNEDNKRVKEDIIKAKVAHDQMMDMLLITTIVCQADMFTRAANELNAIVGALPIDKVDQVRRRIETYVYQGGVNTSGTAVTANLSGASKGLALLTGKAVPADFKNAEAEQNAALDKANADRLKAEKMVLEEQTAREGKSAAGGATPPPPPAAGPPPVPSAPLPVATPVDAAGQAQKSNPFGDAGASSDSSNPFSADKDATAAPDTTGDDAGGAARPISVSSGGMKGKYKVVAVYDHDADADDELGFKVDDEIDVIDDSDDGWWFGRNGKTGKQGLFPVNYVKKV